MVKRFYYWKGTRIAARQSHSAPVGKKEAGPRRMDASKPGICGGWGAEFALRRAAVADEQPCTHIRPPGQADGGRTGAPLRASVNIRPVYTAGAPGTQVRRLTQVWTCRDAPRGRWPRGGRPRGTGEGFGDGCLSRRYFSPRGPEAGGGFRLPQEGFMRYRPSRALSLAATSASCRAMASGLLRCTKSFRSVYLKPRRCAMYRSDSGVVS